MLFSSRNCDYCDTGCERCQPSTKTNDDYEYHVQDTILSMRRLLRILSEHLEYVESFLPDNIPPLTHSKRGEILSDAFNKIRGHVLMLEEYEKEQQRLLDIELEHRLREAELAVVNAQEELKKLRLEKEGKNKQ